MALIGMSEAARRVGVTTDGIRRALQRAGVPLTHLTPRAYAVEEAELEAFLKVRGKLRPGRPRKSPCIRTDGAAQVIEMVLADVEQEIHGPAGVARE